MTSHIMRRALHWQMNSRALELDETDYLSPFELIPSLEVGELYQECELVDDPALPLDEPRRGGGGSSSRQEIVEEEDSFSL